MVNSETSRRKGQFAGAASTAFPPSQTRVHLDPADIGKSTHSTQSAAVEAASGMVRGVLFFNQGGAQTQTGDLVAGGQLEIGYDPARLMELRRDNAAHWGIQAFVQCSPSDITLQGPVRDGCFLTAIPFGTREIQIWFKNWAGFQGQMQESFDSLQGANYRFSVKRGRWPTGIRGS